uniref:HTH CENPB-type domain-containing protein n=1 Tax=Chelonoidis abingdonii TaxID=106734 RepID=A0A8C0ISJ1_CHEAB
MENMERLLSVWIEDQNQRNIHLSMPMIQAKAKSLYDKLKRDQGEGSQTEMFMASRGWFDRFKRRFHLHNMKMSGEVVSADTAAAKKFPEYLKKIIEEGGYSPKQKVSLTRLHKNITPIHILHLLCYQGRLQGFCRPKQQKEKKKMRSRSAALLLLLQSSVAIRQLVLRSERD